MSQLSPLISKGYQLIENFCSLEETTKLKKECDRLVAELNPATEGRSIFNPDKDRKSDNYFLESADKIRYFYEKDAFDIHGQLQVDVRFSLNKIGHALHWHNETFKKFTFGQHFVDLARELGLIDPVVVQSMIIFKNPSIGGEVPSHQDASYLHALPSPEGAVFGFWIPLEDATTENGCLEFVPESHRKVPLETLWQRVTGPNGAIRMEHSNPNFTYSGEFVPCIAPKGSLVLIDGLVVHRSSPNQSLKARPVYTFHVFDQARGKTWDKRNWLQPTAQLAFPSLYNP